MSDWDKNADEGAIKHYSDWCPEGTLESHRRGAKWQRDQLRTEETVERVAEQMFTATQAEYEYMDRTDWNELHKSNQDVYRSDARAAITALLGDKQ